MHSRLLQCLLIQAFQQVYRRLHFGSHGAPAKQQKCDIGELTVVHVHQPCQ